MNQYDAAEQMVRRYSVHQSVQSDRVYETGVRFAIRRVLTFLARKNESLSEYGEAGINRHQVEGEVTPW